MITFEQFMKLTSSFNTDVQNHSLESETQLTDHLRHYLWLDNEVIEAISVIFDPDDVIHSLLLAPYETYPETDNQFSKNTYMMPIQDEWFVFWGGANQFINYHYEIEEQRYAYDLVCEKMDNPIELLQHQKVIFTRLKKKS